MWVDTNRIVLLLGKAINMSRVKDLVGRYSSEAVKHALEIKDPSSTAKYLEWIINAQALCPEFKPTDIENTIKFFHANQSRMANKDIYTYTLPNLMAEIESLGKSKHSTKKEARDNAEKVYEDENWLALYIPEREAMMQYGRGTKWCITSLTSDYFEEYVSSGARFYVVLDKAGTDKYCVSFGINGSGISPLNLQGEVWMASNKKSSDDALMKRVGSDLTNAVLLHAISTPKPVLQSFKKKEITTECFIDWLMTQSPLTVGFALGDGLSYYIYKNTKKNINNELYAKLAKLIVRYVLDPISIKEHNISFREFHPKLAELVVRELTEKKPNPIPWTLAYNLPAKYLVPFIQAPNPRVRIHCVKKIGASDCIQTLLADTNLDVVNEAFKKATRAQKMVAIKSEVRHAKAIRAQCPKTWWLKKAKKKPQDKATNNQQLQKEIQALKVMLGKLMKDKRR